MSDKLNPKELPHEFLLNKYKLSIDKLSKHTQQLKKDLDKTLHLVINRSKDGKVNLTPQTQQKISTYDRYICDGIFEYLEEEEKISETQSEKVEEKMDEKREEVEEKMEDIAEEEKEEIIAEKEEQAQEETPETPEEPEEVKEEEEPEPEPNSADGEEKQEKKDDGVRIGFWDWE